MQNEKTKLYMRTHRLNPKDSFRQTASRKPVGLWMRGVESIGFINGQPIIMVRLQDGAFEPLADLLVTEVVERRKAARSDR
jgi:hypothetical protein